MGKNSKVILLSVLVLLAAFIPALLLIFPFAFFLFLVLRFRAAPCQKPYYSECFISLPCLRSPPC